jgi:hypothetical protein
VTIRLSETSVHTRTTRQHISEDVINQAIRLWIPSAESRVQSLVNSYEDVGELSEIGVGFQLRCACNCSIVVSHRPLGVRQSDQATIYHALDPKFGIPSLSGTWLVTEKEIYVLWCTSVFFLYIFFF